jgi:phosphohistidine phosphatase
MNLYVVRHAIAAKRDAEQWPDDSKRPLTDEGSTRFRRAAAGLRRLVPQVDVVLSSEYTRAWQTAELLHDVTGWPAPEKLTELEATESAADLAKALGRRTEESIALVGHEPQLSRLTSLLLSGSETTVRVEPKKGGVIAIVFDGSPDPGAGTLAWNATPKILRGLERSA